MKPTVFIDHLIPSEVRAYIAEHCEIVSEEGALLPRHLLLEQLAEVNGLMSSRTLINSELLDRAPQLRVVSSVSVGYNHYDLTAMKERGIIGTHTPYVLDDTVADLAFLLILGTARRVAELDRYVKDGRWSVSDGANLFGRDVHHASLGIIGMGRIGEALARRAKLGFDMEVRYYNRTRKPDAEQKLGVRYADLKELLAESDFVVMLAPLTKETAGMIGREEFKLMKPSAIFINVSRGQTIDEAALIEALQQGKLAAAGLDVYEQEPIAADHPLLQMNNVLTLPHIGSATAQTRAQMAMLAAQNLVAGLTNGTATHIVAELR